MTDNTADRPTTNLRSWSIKRSYTNNVEVRSAIACCESPICFDPDEIEPGWEQSVRTNTCGRCGETYRSYHVLLRNNSDDIANYISDEYDHLCKSCRVEETDYGAYLTSSEYDAIQAFGGDSV